MIPGMLYINFILLLPWTKIDSVVKLPPLVEHRML